MKELCKNCDVCVGLGIREQLDERILEYKVGKEEVGETPPSVLIIDDHYGGRDVPLTIIRDIFPGSTPVSYTHTIRCLFGGKDLSKDNQWIDAVNRCAVWTNLIIGDRQIILSTSAGLRQMGIGISHWEDGRILKSPAHGLILCISPLHSASGMKVERYRVQVERMIASLKTGEKV